MESPGVPLEVDLEMVEVGDDREARLRVAGEIDFGTVVDLELALASVTDRCRHVVVDLGAVEFIDSAGLRALVVARNTLAGAGGALVITGAGELFRVFELGGLSEVFTFEA